MEVVGSVPGGLVLVQAFEVAPISHPVASASSIEKNCLLVRSTHCKNKCTYWAIISYLLSTRLWAREKKTLQCSHFVVEPIDF